MSELRIKNGHEILSTKKQRSTMYYQIRCIKCGFVSWRSGGFLKAKAICPNCSGGKHLHNSRGYNCDPLFGKYWIIRRRLKSNPHYAEITMCEEWENDFTAFRNWAMENGYKEGLTIDRIDNSKGYSPDNCRWVTPKQQANNRSSNVFVEYDGKRLTLSELADYVGLSRTTIKQRYENGWDLEDIAKTPYSARKKWSETNGQ